MINANSIKILTVISACLFSSLAGAQVFPRHRDDDKLKGKVKSISEIRNNQSREIKMYNEKGYQTDYWVFTPLEILHYRLKAVYNDSGQVLEETRFDKGIDPVHKYVYAYNNYRRLIGRSTWGRANALLQKHIYSYDSVGNMTDSIQLDPGGKIIDKCSRQYDERGRLIREHLYNGSILMSTVELKYDQPGRLTEKITTYPALRLPDITTIYTYDAGGKLIFEEWSSADSTKEQKRSFSYDSAGHLVNYISLGHENRFIEKTSYAYDPDSRLIMTNHYDTGGLVFRKVTHVYDGKGNEIELKSFEDRNKQETIITWQYEYDKTGNWIKRTEFINQVANEVITRDIEYY